MNPAPEPAPAQDRGWAGDARAATGLATLFPALLLAVDTAAGSADWRRVVVWTALGLALFLVLWPTRVRAVPGLLTTRGLVHRRRVHTDRLASVAWHDGVAQRLVLRDIDGNRLEVDPRVLAANPPLWHVLDRDIHTSLARGTMREGLVPLRRLCRLIDRETAHTVFRASGLA
ncbi:MULTISPECIES: hypothetical protein [unclassified Streptomyces]|uniref:hypothetical protein n=1 Tax=unclassified Streptomyces TaxID=2593676 RepID=UPI00225A7230|nr:MULTISPECIES: hypothetical protein [unclassified Streptomyces]MCX4524550.1 hypothetical protein [Streptomyces sp. NBC_01551]MCX4544926.1 hypothetical protein [Streptomyces sp. NBC_01565]